MKMENSAYQWMPMSQYCSGISTKNASDRARWSPGLVGVSVMNSRKAKNEMKANITMVAFVPIMKAVEKTATIAHHARTRALRLSITAWELSLPARRSRTLPMIDAAASTQAMAPISQ